jgi:proteic killer suppression protein
MIRSYANKETKDFFENRKSRTIPANIQRVALRKLAQVHAVTELSQLSVPPGNRLETLRGDRRGQHSIRINDQWRICFRWKADGPHDVQIADYHP